MLAKKKKPSKNFSQPGLRTPKNTFVRRHKWLVIAVVFILGGMLGVALQRYSRATGGIARWSCRDDRYGGLAPCSALEPVDFDFCHESGLGPNCWGCTLDQAEQRVTCNKEITGPTARLCWPVSTLYAAERCYVTAANPALACSGVPKLDILILVEAAEGIEIHESTFGQAKEALVSFIEALDGQDVTIAVSEKHRPERATFHRNNTEAVKAARNLQTNSMNYAWFVGDVSLALSKEDWRPDAPNLVILFNGGWGGNASLAQSAKASGNRVLVIGLTGRGNYTPYHLLLSGPRADTGNVWTSDVITTHQLTGAQDFSQTKKDLLKAAQQLKSCPANAGAGPGGPGNGNNGPGSGSGNTGSGTGTRGSGSGGGGTSATRQGDSSNPLPKSSPQGTKQQDPPKQEPSPFFDGKLYGIGSDPDAQSPVDLVRSPSKILKNVWFYVIVGTMLLAGGVGAGYWFWWRKRS